MLNTAYNVFFLLCNVEIRENFLMHSRTFTKILWYFRKYEGPDLSVVHSR